MLGFFSRTQHTNDRSRLAGVVQRSCLSAWLSLRRAANDRAPRMACVLTRADALSMKTLMCVAISMVFAQQAAAEVFAFESGGRQYEADVTAEALTLREKRDDPSADAGAFTCPLGSAVRANVVPAGANGTKVCLVFSKQQCSYGNDPRAAGSRSASGSFKCIDFADVQQAQSLASLINAGPQPEAAQEPPVPAAAGRAAPQGSVRSNAEPVSPARSPAAPASAANAASAAKASSGVRAGGPSGPTPAKGVVRNQTPQASGKPAAAAPQPAAVDRSNGEVRPDDKRGQMEGAERRAHAALSGAHGIRVIPVHFPVSGAGLTEVISS